MKGWTQMPDYATAGGLPPGSRVYRYQIDELPSDTICISQGYAYIADLGSGFIKAGVTSRPTQRMKQHAFAAAIRGGTLGRIWFSTGHRGFFTTEFFLLAALKELSSGSIGREYFSGVSFEDAVAEAAKLAAWDRVAAGGVDASEARSGYEVVSRIIELGGRETGVCGSHRRFEASRDGITASATIPNRAVSARLGRMVERQMEPVLGRGWLQ
jgi:hypothetical protein